MRKVLTRLRAGALAATIAATGVGACGGTAGNEPAPTAADTTVVVVTTSVLGDIVTAALGDMVGDTIEVEVVIPAGADVHEFAPSARQAETMENADLLVENGLGAEGAMTDLIAAVRDGGTEVFTVTDALDGLLIEGDPHVWLDPDAMATAITAFASALVETTDVEPADVARNTAAYVDDLRTLDAAISATLAPIPPARRSLVTNHDSLAYFARRYDFTVNGTVISSVSTTAEASAADLEALAALIRDNGLPAIFVETSESDRLAQAVADEVDADVAVVPLFTGSLGAPGTGADTYLGAMRVNADRIRAALA